jgi:glycosyltransferase involved in cell wall biosynthesis
MRLSLVTEHRFSRTPDGAVWAPDASGYAFWRRYLSIFEEVNVAARIAEVPHGGGQGVRADGPGVRFSAVPHYLGPYQFALRWPSIRRALARAIRADDAVIFRVPSFLANCIEPTLYERGQPYGLEVVGDPYDGLGPGGIRHLLRPFLRVRVPWQLRRQCARAAGVAYVTKSVLQRRYPSRGMMVGVSDAVIPSVNVADADTVFTTHYSSLSLAQGMVSFPRTGLPAGPLRLICVASLEQYYKGHDILLRAVADCVGHRADLRLVLVGDGRIRPEIEALASALGIRDRCEFLGQLAHGRAVLEELDRSDLFVLPSRTEGLPRALIEAMARGLPCISTSVGGIPELLPPEDLVPPDDVNALAAKILEVIASVELRGRMSHRNVGVAQEYTEDVLQTRRVEFFRHIRAVTNSRTRRE